MAQQELKQVSVSSELAASVAYLSSPAAAASLARDPYWPKWDSPWWHMLLLFEMGEVAQIPPAVVRAMIDGLNAYPVKTFPIHEHELPPGADPFRHIACHCQIGSIYQLLHACGVNVDAEVPWLRPRLLSYQMADGGLSCDDGAYRAEGEAPSSMVGTIAVFEALLHCTERPYTEEEQAVLQRAAGFLQTRRLVEGSSTRYNSEERKEAEAWRAPFFPRFYFYDILRGLDALFAYAEKCAVPLPEESYREAFDTLSAAFPGEEVVNAGKAYDKQTTLLFTGGEWRPKQPALGFPLLEATRAAGRASPALGRQWARVRARHARLSRCP